MGRIYTETLYSNEIKPKTTTGNIDFPAGHVIQVVTDLKTLGDSSGNGLDADIQSVSVTGTTFATGYTTNSLTLTPKYASSKILLMWSGMINTSAVSGVGAEVYFAKDGGQLLTSGGDKNAHVFEFLSGTSTQLYRNSSAAHNFIAGSTNQMTLSVVISKFDSTGYVQLRQEGTHHLTAMEIRQ